jgi:hypothetical protein
MGIAGNHTADGHQFVKMYEGMNVFMHVCV